ncbi:MAG: YybH family protein [Acidimicrobiia bacterium]
MEVSDPVLDANQAFYDAHEARDLVAMADIWAHTDDVVCVHPGWPILRGWSMVEESWRRIFEGAGRNQFILTNVSVAATAGAAWVTLEENLVDRGTTHAMTATNVFVEDGDGGWRIVAHHAGPVFGQ